MSTPALAEPQTKSTTQPEPQSADLPKSNQRGPSPASEAPDDGMFLSQHDREMTTGTVIQRISLAAVQYSYALQSARMEALFKTQSGWGPIGDIIYAATTAVCMIGIEAVAATVAAELVARSVARGLTSAGAAGAAVAAQKGQIISAVRQATTVARGELSALCAGLPPGPAQKVKFLDMLANSSSTFFDSFSRAIRAGTDVGLMLGYYAFDPTRMTANHYRSSIESSFARYESLGLDEVGMSSRRGPAINGTREVVKLVAFGQTRLAIVVFHEDGVTINDRSVSGYKDKSYFVKWVDDDFTSAATEVQTKQMGSMREIDVSLPQMYVFEDEHLEVETWASRQRNRRRP